MKICGMKNVGFQWLKPFRQWLGGLALSPFLLAISD
ncbi:unnamed protein product [Brassica oleracea var. botrytis]